MPFKRERYPADWEAISRRIRFERAGNKCEWCGAENYQPHPVTGGKVVLTVAHINHDTTDNSDANLAALCNRCHLTHDAKHHAANAKVTRAAKKQEAIKASGQRPLFKGE